MNFLIWGRVESLQRKEDIFLLHIHKYFETFLDNNEFCNMVSPNGNHKALVTDYKDVDIYKLPLKYN